MMADIQTIVIESWEHALKVLYADSWNPKTKKFISPFVFRGLERTDYKLVTTLQRIGANNPGEIANLERYIFRTFKKYAFRDVVSKDTTWHWLAMAQHHGLATRLLDWTWSPLVATAIVPDYALGSHTAPLGLASSVGTSLPAPFENGMFIGQHGSWNRQIPNGYRVIFVPFSNGMPFGDPVEVLTG